MPDTSPELLEQQGIHPATPLAADERCGPYGQPHEGAQRSATTWPSPTNPHMDSSSPRPGSPADEDRR